MEEKKNAYGWQEKRCIDCGKEFLAKSPNQTRCTDCRIIYKREYMRKYSKEQRKRERAAIVAAREEMGLPANMKRGPRSNSTPKPVKKTDDPNICKKIKSCYYGGYMGAEHICDYLGKTGVRRPCKAGECYFYKRKGRKNEQDRNSQGDM